MVDEIDVGFGSCACGTLRREHQLRSIHRRWRQRRMFTARAATNNTVVAEIADSIIILTLW